MTKKKAKPPARPPHTDAPATREARLDFHYKEFKSRGLGDAECKRLAREVVARDDDPTTPNPPLELSAHEREKLEKKEQARLDSIPPEPELPEPRTLEEVTPAHLRQSLDSMMGQVKLEGHGIMTPPGETPPAQ